MQVNTQPQLQEEESIDLLELFYKLWAHKWVFLFSGIIALSAALFYLRMSTPIYRVDAVVAVIEEGAQGKISGGMGQFSMSDMFAVSTPTENEIEALRSKNLLYAVVNELELYTAITREGFFRNTELYGNAPLRLGVSHPALLRDTLLMVEGVDAEECRVINDADSVITLRYGTSIPFCQGTLLISAPGSLPKGERLIVHFRNPRNLVNSLASRLTIAQIKKTNAVTLSLQESSVARGEAILAEMVRQHNLDKVNYDRRVGEKTNEFIVDRLRVIDGELSNIETSAETFKRQNEITDIPTEAGYLGENREKIKEQLFTCETELRMIAFIEEYLTDTNRSGYSILPENLILSDKSVSGGITQYNELILRREQLLQSAGSNSPLLVALDNQLAKLSESILQSIRNARSTLDIRVAQITSHQREVDHRISSSPSLEKEYRGIARRQELTEQIYLFLMQKSEETKIAMIALVGNVKIIDSPSSTGLPIAPRKPIILLAALILAFLLPAGYILLREMLNIYVRSKKDFERYPQLPFVGTVMLEGTEKSTRDNYNFGFDSRMRFESFSLIQENLKFSGLTGERNVLLVTSSVSGEGKSFCSSNLAYNFAKMGKRVLLIGTDMRKPTLHRIFGLSKQGGLSEYLAGIKTNLTELIKPVRFCDNLFVLTAGSIPPNPTVLLSSVHMEELIARVRREYDYVVIDASPIMLVPDAVVLARHVDTTLYVAGAGILSKKQIPQLVQMRSEGKLPNFTVLLNRVRTDAVGYSYGYGYNYGYGYGYGYGGYGYGRQSSKKQTIS